MVRVTVPKKIHTKVIWQLAQKLAKQAGLQMYQLMLGHDPEIGVWENPRPDKNYRHLVWAVPLCNRNTHISGSIIASVVTVFQDTMRKVGGIADFSSQNDIQKRLEKVDEFCNHVDHKVTVYLLASREDEGMPRRCGEIISLALTEKLKKSTVVCYACQTAKSGSGYMPATAKKLSANRRIARSPAWFWKWIFLMFLTLMTRCGKCSHLPASSPGYCVSPSRR